MSYNPVPGSTGDFSPYARPGRIEIGPNPEDPLVAVLHHIASALERIAKAQERSAQALGDLAQLTDIESTRKRGGRNG